MTDEAKLPNIIPVGIPVEWCLILGPATVEAGFLVGIRPPLDRVGHCHSSQQGDAARRDGLLFYVRRIH